MLRTKEPLTLNTIFSIAHDLKKQGKTIGFTHGAFDLFHYGHLYLLRKTAQKCDFLVVGVDSDANIARYKSYYRPIIGEHRRLQIISELNCVGGAFINYEGTSDEIQIMFGRELKTDILAAGRNYGREDGILREADHLKAKLFWFKRNYESTTNIVNRILDLHTRKYPNQHMTNKKT